MHWLGLTGCKSEARHLLQIFIRPIPPLALNLRADRGLWVTAARQRRSPSRPSLAKALQIVMMIL